MRMQPASAHAGVSPMAARRPINSNTAYVMIAIETETETETEIETEEGIVGGTKLRQRRFPGSPRTGIIAIIIAIIIAQLVLIGVLIEIEIKIGFGSVAM